MLSGAAVLPGHFRHPRSVDEIGINGGEEGLLVRVIIDGETSRLDHGITAAGLGKLFGLKDHCFNIVDHNEMMNYRP